MENTQTADSGRRGKVMQGMGAIIKRYGSDYLAAGRAEQTRYRVAYAMGADVAVLHNEIE